MITGEAKFLRYQDAIYAFWTDNLRLAGKGKIGCNFRQEIVVIAGLACVLFD